MTRLFETSKKKYAIYLEHSQEDSIYVSSSVDHKNKNTENINSISLEIVKEEESSANNIEIKLTKNNSHINQLIRNIKETLYHMESELEELDGLIDTLIKGGKHVTWGYYAINEELFLSTKLPTDIFDFSIITAKHRLFLKVTHSQECGIDGLQQILTKLGIPLDKNVPILICSSHGDTPSILFAIS